jgi:hypothetical protein
MPKKKEKFSEKKKKEKKKAKDRASSELAILQDSAYRSGYTFVVQQTGSTSYSWRYVGTNYDDDLVLSDNPRHLFPEINDDVLELWKRIAIDNVFTWQARNVVPSTLRLVKVETRVVDATAEIFPHQGEYETQMKFATLSKMTPQEAKLLGVEKDYVLMKMFSRKDRDVDDEKLIVRFTEMDNDVELFDIDKVLG